jgi:deoxyhypusine synthase
LFGPHLMIDGSKCNTQKLADRNLIEQILNDYPRAIGMTKIGGPYMFEYQAPDPEYSGISGLVVIAESHIAIHTFPELDYFTMDIFSCRNFDHELAIQYIKDALDVQEMDRILLQRGLSFHGPHHGSFGSDAETGQPLERAAGARAEGERAATVVPASRFPQAPAAEGAGRRAEDLAPLNGREAALQEHLARRAEQANAGRMIWPQYGVTPDFGTYGANAPDPSKNSVKANGNGKKNGHHQPGQPPELTATEPIQVNPTASISGVLDKMGGLGGEGHKLSTALSLWERMARDPGCTILLGLSGPLIPAGMRELIVYLIEHRYIDGVVASASNLFHDLHEARGSLHYHADQGNEAALIASGYERAADLAASRAELRQTEGLLIDFSATLGQSSTLTTSAFFRRLGAALRHMAPRKGVIQAAAEAGIPVYAPDIASSQFGVALAAARAQGKAHVQFDTTGDALELAGMLTSAQRSGVILVGSGADAPAELLRQAARISSDPIVHSYSVALGGSEALPGLESVASSTDATLTLPLVAHGLAQRCPGTRPEPSRKAAPVELVNGD